MPAYEQECEKRRGPRQKHEVRIQEADRRAQGHHRGVGREKECGSKIGHRGRSAGNVGIPEGPLALVDRLLQELGARLPLPPRRTRIVKICPRQQVAASPLLMWDEILSIVLRKRPIVDRVQKIRCDEGAPEEQHIVLRHRREEEQKCGRVQRFPARNPIRVDLPVGARSDHDGLLLHGRATVRTSAKRDTDAQRASNHTWQRRCDRAAASSARLLLKAMR
jgi:hypothetical protein